MIRGLPRYRQLNLVSIALLSAMAAVATLQGLDPSDSARTAGHLLVLVSVAAVAVFGIRRSACKPTWLLPRMTLACFALGSVASLVAGNYVVAASGALTAAILPLFLTDERWNTLFRYDIHTA